MTTTPRRGTIPGPVTPLDVNDFPDLLRLPAEVPVVTERNEDGTPTTTALLRAARYLAAKLRVNPYISRQLAEFRVTGKVSRRWEDQTSSLED